MIEEAFYYGASGAVGVVLVVLLTPIVCGTFVYIAEQILHQYHMYRDPEWRAIFMEPYRGTRDNPIREYDR